jgi:DnaK suppressor protein
MASKRWQHQVRQRIQRERDEAIAQLRGLGLSEEPSAAARRGNADQPRDEGDQAQASEHRDLSFMTRERLAARINRLSAALERMSDGTYGRCELCGRAIERPRLEALPEAVTCRDCQERAERVA